MIAYEIERLCRRFEIAVANFGQSCIAMRANEKAFQAWFAASVIQEFGLSRVYREIHLAKKELFEASPDLDVPRVLREGNELFPDVSVSWLPDIDARHSNTRDHSIRSAGDFLLKFALLTELKVTGSGGKSTAPKHIKTDLWKLALFSSVHAKHMERRCAKPDDHEMSLRTYMVIMDNFATNGAFKSSYSAAKLKQIFDELSGQWPEYIEKPTVVVICSGGQRAKIAIYRNFTEDHND